RRGGVRLLVRQRAFRPNDSIGPAGIPWSIRPGGKSLRLSARESGEGARRNEPRDVGEGTEGTSSDRQGSSGRRNDTQGDREPGCTDNSGCAQRQTQNRAERDERAAHKTCWTWSLAPRTSNIIRREGTVRVHGTGIAKFF